MTRYTLGFAISIILTLVAYFAVTNSLFTSDLLVYVLVGLALIQLVIQLVFFLHLDSEQGLRWNLPALMSTVGVVLILVVGSIWIMNNLKYRHNVPDTETILQNEAIPK